MKEQKFNKSATHFAFNVDRIEVELPLFIEKAGRKWIDYGSDNLYPQFVAGLYMK